MGMAEDGGTPAAHVIEVDVAIGVRQAAALGALDEGREPAHGVEGPDRAVYSAHDELLRPPEQAL
jgi:hypothetical protein